ncbi:TetR/AcrR family transcriptional regulator [Patulibacter sp. NPDC049589]|uniref:TetR/AcrR family transcriptional regulator n=1 Tax=Patulibacter sp. NPDC049589 TaxID=3154731 RepID=UPI00341EDA7F
MNQEQIAPRTRRTPRADVRAGILEAAATVFADQGFAATSVDQVAAAAGFSKGAVYSNFAGKDELFFAILEQRSATRARLAAEAEDARTVGRGLAEAHDADPAWIVLLIEFWTHALRDAALRERLEEHRAPLRAEIARAIDDLAAREGRQLPLPAEDLAVAAIAMTNGLTMERTADGAPGATLLPRILPLLFGEVTR